MKKFYSACKLFLAVIWLFSLHATYGNEERPPQKVIICGVCRNIEPAVPNTISNIEMLGSRFTDYAVIIYENNSTDNTASRLSAWAEKNPHVVFTSETLSSSELPPTRPEQIARARNHVLSLAKDPKYGDFAYLIMADLDFLTPWPIDEIVRSINLPFEWDCISANGVTPEGSYYDRYAFRNDAFPFGPEMIGYYFWFDLRSQEKKWFELSGDSLIPIYSAYGGLAIYKTASIFPFSYSGTPTDELAKYYKQIASTLSPTNRHLQKYLTINKMESGSDLLKNPIVFQKDLLLGDVNQCCEHLPLHASMAINGFGKFYINPKMYMRYTANE